MTDAQEPAIPEGTEITLPWYNNGGLQKITLHAALLYDLVQTPELGILSATFHHQNKPLEAMEISLEELGRHLQRASANIRTLHPLELETSADEAFGLGEASHLGSALIRFAGAANAAWLIWNTPSLPEQVANALNPPQNSQQDMFVLPERNTAQAAVASERESVLARVKGTALEGDHRLTPEDFTPQIEGLRQAMANVYTFYHAVWNAHQDVIGENTPLVEGLMLCTHNMYRESDRRNVAERIAHFVENYGQFEALLDRLEHITANRAPLAAAWEQAPQTGKTLG